MFLMSSWTFAVFLFAADRELPRPLIIPCSILIWVTVVMILRVYAMWFQSTTVLCILLFVYALQVVTSTVFIAIYNDPDTYFPGTSRAKFTPLGK